ncbi:DNA (cytosine-5)-methyltransferase 3C [Frankliniella fusca]|uniref:DNA (Cytosine-5)-methyltransferase 3C n=1 Tax=Frankliniella fusca TaxID=407009 RepID=A0AAE1LPU4_9NEOP|nr:DNA (cytosine-5)-methyltransferase 3C [Frankliniella fusca]
MVRKKSHLTSRKNKQTKFNQNRALRNKEKRLSCLEVAQSELIYHDIEEDVEVDLSCDGFRGFETPITIPSFEPKAVLQGMASLMPRNKVLSLFDRLASGLVALKEGLHLDVEKYYSGEIDPHRIHVQNHNYPEELVPLGPIEDITP